MSSAVAGETPLINLAEDLEDGEIDDDDEEEEQKSESQQQQQQQQPVQTQQQKPLGSKPGGSSNDEVQFVGIERLSEKQTLHDDDVIFLGIASETAAQNSNKSKKPRPLEDDHAVSIENAIAKALKKGGIEPPLPKLNNSNNANSDADGGANAGGDGGSAASGPDACQLGGQQQQQQPTSRSSRRRKRKKEREREQKKDKEHQKRARRDSMDDVVGPAGSEEMEMDEYEMMNVRGGSPPPGGANAASGAAAAAARYPGDWPGMGDDAGYESPPDNYSSYDSYSDDEPGSAAVASMGTSQRRRLRREREKEMRGGRKRRDRERDRDRDRDLDRRHDGGVGAGGAGNAGGGALGNKRNRRDSIDDKSRSEPRKLELCKFYLKDCCAKRDKCSYMHKEFPCKYYYLGMDCYAGEDCLFHHGEPLTEQLRNILLKHMETAPKEILGDFKRISRDIALSQMTRRHEQLCEQYEMENSWTTLASAGISRLQDQQHSAAKAAAQAANQAAAIAAVNANLQQQQQQAAAATAAAGGGAIPSLLDMVINPPVNLHHGDSKPEKKRKSRWAEKAAAGKAGAAAAAASAAGGGAATVAASSSSTGSTGTPTKSLPPHLDLVNLTQVLSAEHMAKLNKLGITNLEQMMQVPFGQLTEVGLTLPELGEIQRKAEEAKPQEPGTGSTGSAATAPAAAAATATEVKSTAKSNQESSNVSGVVSSNSNSNSNNGFIMVDYTQYLKDAHVNFPGSDPLDDDREEDEEQLVIDDGNEEEEDESESDAKPKKSKRSSEEEEKEKKPQSQLNAEEETPPMPSVFDLPTFMSNMLGQKTAPTATATAESAPSTPEKQQPPPESSPSKSGQSPSGGGLFGKLQFGSFYKDIIRNPFKTNSSDAPGDDGDNNDSQPASSAPDNDVSSFSFLDGSHYSNSNSRSLTPTPTPEPGSQSPKGLGGESSAQLPPALGSSGATDVAPAASIYARPSMYDFDPEKAALEDARASAAKRERDRDIDMRLPFEPMKHYLPATEIDAAIFSHIPIRWQIREVLVEQACYAQLRQSASHKEQRDLRDPRIRRILGLPELTDETGAGSGSGSTLGGSGGASSSSSMGFTTERRERKTSNCIASPDAQMLDSTPSSPPPASSSSSAPVLPPMNVPPPAVANAADSAAGGDPRRTDPRRDPRRAHLSSSNSNAANAAVVGAGVGAGASATSINAVNDSGRQISEIRNLLQSSNWYKNLGSNNKIMVNQQLALVFTELKKFHQQESPNKIFDVNFIVNNQTLQQIFAKLHIYIDDNGLVVQLPEEPPQNVQPSVVVVPNMPPILPNMSQPPPNLVQMLRQPPPNVGRMMPMGGMSLPPFNQPPPQRSNSILGMPPNVMGVMNGNPFNPFANNNLNLNNLNLNGMNNMNNMNMNGMNSMNGMNMNNLGVAFNGGGGGPGPGPGPFKNFGPGGNNGNQGGRHFAGNRNRGGGGGGGGGSGSGHRNRN